MLVALTPEMNNGLEQSNKMSTVCNVCTALNNLKIHCTCISNDCRV